MTKQLTNFEDDEDDYPSLTEADFKRMRPYRTGLLSRLANKNKENEVEIEILTKPFHIDELVSKIQNVVNKSKGSKNTKKKPRELEQNKELTLTRMAS